MTDNNTILDGYYWYFPANDDDIPDLQDVQVVQVFDSATRVAICGSDVTYDVYDCKGRFVRVDQPSE